LEQILGARLASRIYGESEPLNSDAKILNWIWCLK
jgi:hypothetical protein